MALDPAYQYPWCHRCWRSSNNEWLLPMDVHETVPVIPHIQDQHAHLLFCISIDWSKNIGHMLLGRVILFDVWDGVCMYSARAI